MNRLLLLLIICLLIPTINRAQDINDCEIVLSTIDSFKLNSYRKPIPILENCIENQNSSISELPQIKALLQIAYFNTNNLKIDFSSLTDLTNQLSNKNPYFLNLYKIIVSGHRNLNDARYGIMYGEMGLKKYFNYRKNVYYAELLAELASAYSDCNEYKKAIDYFKKAIWIIDQYFNGVNKSYTYWLMGISSNYFKLKKYKRAITYELMVAERKENFAIGFSYSNLSRYYRIIGDTLNSIKYNNKFISSFESKDLDIIIKNNFQKENKEARTSFDNKNVCYEKLITKQLKIVEQSKDIYGINSLKYASSMAEQAYFYSQLDDYENAIKYSEGAISVFMSMGYETNIEYINSVINLSLYYAKSRRFDESINISSIAIDILQSKLGVNSENRISSLKKIELFPNHFLTIDKYYYKIAILLHNNAFAYSEQQQYNKAIELESEAVTILEKVGKKNNYEDSKPIELLSNCYFQIDNCNEAITNLNKVIDLRRTIVSSRFNYYSEIERQNYWSYIKKFFESRIPSLSYNCLYRQNIVQSPAYNNALFSKGLLLNTSLQIQNTILQSGDSATIQIWNNLKQLKRQIDYLQTRQPSQQTELPQLEQQADSLDKILTKKSQLFKQNKEALQVKWQDVQKALHPNEASIEFVSFDYYNGKQYTDSTLYYALVLKKNDTLPQLIPLFEQRLLDSLFMKDWKPKQLYQYRASMSRNGETEKELNYGEKLYNLVWKPLENCLSGVERIYYSPSGTLNNVAFYAIPVDSIHYLSDKYDLHQVTSTREILHQDSSSTKSITASVFGGIQYDLTDSTVQKRPVDFQNKQLSVRSYFIADSTSSRSTGFKYLKGTDEEVKSISRNFDRSGYKSTLYTDDKATEFNFKQLSNTNTHIIHIATHGFYLPVEKVKHNEFEFMGFDGNQRNVVYQNPLLRSGLALYGANKAWRGEEVPNDWEDGILTSQEISELNLTQTDLVVLSACETALGEIKGSEGVFGLQRAFKMAGVKSMIVSLWKVDDSATSQMMQSFYKYWLGGMSKHEAFKKAQGEIRALHPNDPYFWAAFVLID